MSTQNTNGSAAGAPTKNTGTALPSPGPRSTGGKSVSEAAQGIASILTDDGDVGDTRKRPAPSRDAAPADTDDALLDEFEDNRDDGDQGGNESGEDTPDEHDDGQSEGTEKDGIDGTEQGSEEDEDGDDPDQDLKGRKVRVKVDGKNIDVLIDELKKGYLRQKDYTTKTMELAEGRKAISGEYAVVSQNRQALDQLLEVAFEQTRQLFPREPDWVKLSENPSEYARTRAEWDKYQQMLHGIASDRARNQQAMQEENQRHMSAFVHDEAQKLIQAIPEMGDQTKAKERMGRWQKAAHQLGFSADEIRTVVDHRVLRALDIVAQHLDLVDRAAKRAKSGTARPGDTPAPRAATPGVQKSSNRQSARSTEKARAVKQLQRTGSVRDAAAAIALLDL